MPSASRLNSDRGVHRPAWSTVLQLVTALAFATSAVHASTINVPGGQPTIQAAINAASPGDVVIVAAGTYYENLTLTLPMSLTLQGAQQGVPACDRVALETIVQAANVNSPVLDIRSGAGLGLVIDGFTFDSGGGNPIACVRQRLGATPGLQFLNNRLLGFQNSGLAFNSSADDAIIRGNDIDGSTTNASGSLLFLSTNTYNGIQIVQNCLHNSHLYGWFVDGNRNVGIGTNPAVIMQNTFKANNTGANTGSRSLLSA